MTKELSEFRKEDILNSDLIGEGLPDLETEIAKLQSGETGLDTGLDFVPQSEPDEALDEEED